MTSPDTSAAEVVAWKVLDQGLGGMVLSWNEGPSGAVQYALVLKSALDASRAETAAANARADALERERDKALTEHTDMMWQRQRADERSEAAEAKLAAVIDRCNRSGVTQIPAGTKRPDLEELRELLGPYPARALTGNRTGK